MKVRLSGRILVEVDDETIDLGAQKCQAVFAALALSPGHPVSVSEIIALVWGTQPPRTAEKTLQSYITRLRKVLGEAVLTREGGGYRLDVDPDAVDLVSFERLLAVGDKGGALRLWNGRPLAGLDGGGFDAIITRFTEQHLGAVEGTFEAEVAHGNGASVVGQLGQLTNEHPLRERLLALYMQALYQAGRQADALRVFSAARSRLVDELGIEPGPQLQELEARLLAHDPTLGGSKAPVVSEREINHQVSTGLSTFLISEISDSTGLWERHPDEMRSMVEHHDVLVSEEVARTGGDLFKHTGDGVVCWFPDADAAVDAAVAIQLAVDDWRLGSDDFTIRIGIATGRAQHRDGDWFGPPLNIAARLMDAAHAGQILTADATCIGLTNNLTAGVETSDLGEVRLRGLSRPESVHQVLHPALPRRFPPLRTTVHDASDATEFPAELAYDGQISFVGRSDLLGELVDLWTEARTTNSPKIVTLGGEPGIGKTRLAAELARRCHTDDGATVIYGRCPEEHRTPFRPFTEAFSAYAAARSDAELRTEMGHGAAALAAVAPVLGQRFSDLSDLSRRATHSEGAQLAIFDAVVTFLQSAASSPLVLILDDVHWSDHQSLDLLRHLSQRLATGRLLIVATYRDVEVERTHPLGRALVDMRREAKVKRVTVEPLSIEDGIALTEATFGHELSENGRAAASSVASDASGNPFFLQELLRDMRDSGTLVRRDGRWTATSSASVAAVPEGIREIVGRRLDRVSDACNTMLRAASAMPDEIDFDVLVTVTEMDEEEALDGLDEALDADLIVDAARPSTYQFNHALIRQTLYGEISTARRLRLHNRIAAALEVSRRPGPNHTDQVAFHYLEAATSADPEKVTEWALRSVRSALDRSAVIEAQDAIERLCDVVEGAVDDATWFEIQIVRARSFVGIDSAAEAGAAEAAAAVCEELFDCVDPAAAGAGVLELAGSVTSRSFMGGGFESLARLLGRVDTRALIPPLQGRLRAERVRLLDRNAADPDALLEQFSSPNPAEQINAARMLFVIPTQREGLSTLLSATEDVIASSNDQPVVDTMLFVRAIAADRLWQVDRSEQDLKRICESPLIGLHSDFVYPIARLRPLPSSIHRGDLAKAEQTVEEWSDSLFISEYAARLISWARDVPFLGPPDFTDPFAADMTTRHRASPHMRSGPLDPSALIHLVELVVGEDTGARCAVVEAVDETGVVELAQPLFELLEPFAGLSSPYYAGFIVAAIDHYLGILSELVGNFDAAMGRYESALQQHQAVGFVYDVAATAERIVRLTARGFGDVDAARTIGLEALAGIENTELNRMRRLLSEALELLK